MSGYMLLLLTLTLLCVVVKQSKAVYCCWSSRHTLLEFLYPHPEYICKFATSERPAKVVDYSLYLDLKSFVV